MSITQRIDAITGITDEYCKTVCPAPRSVKIELTANCNYKCGFCVKSIRPDNGVMDRALFSRLIREMRAAGVEELGLFYIGESFTCHWLPAAIREAKEVGFPYVFLTTNGSAATPAKVRECMEAGLDSLKFSLNFDSPYQLEQVAGVSGKFWQKAIDNLKAACRIRNEGYKCKVYASSIAFDGKQGERMQAVIDDVKPYLDEHYFLPLYGMSGASKNIGWKPKPGNPGRLDNMREPLPCWATFTEGHITKDGKMVACCFGTGIGGDLVMGDLTQERFMDAWNSDAYQELRQAHLNKDVRGTACESCAAA
jgi:radical SAM protein with 4Fe4S-binding SPASM domain